MKKRETDYMPRNPRGRRPSPEHQYRQGRGGVTQAVGGSELPAPAPSVSRRLGRYLERHHAPIAAGERLIRWCNRQPCETIALLGNHEGYDRIERLPIVGRFGGSVYRVSERISILQDGNLYTNDGKTFFVFGGGDSVDENRRFPGESWWPQEIPTQKQLKRGLETLCAVDGVVDYVVSHACPRNVLEHMEDKDLLVHRLKVLDPTVDMLTRLWRKLTDYQGWYFGHFHLDFEWRRYRGLWEDRRLLVWSAPRSTGSRQVITNLRKHALLPRKESALFSGKSSGPGIRTWDGLQDVITQFGDLGIRMIRFILGLNLPPRRGGEARF